VLADVDHGVAMSYGVLFSVPKATRGYYSGLGIDLGKRHASSRRMLPIPATTAIDRDGRIRHAFVEPDFRSRQEPTEILAAVRRLALEN
jgi:peroxiredoxin